MSFHLLSLAIVTILLIIVGTVVGWIHSNGKKKKVQRRLRTALAAVVAVVWITTVVADILIAAYTVSPLVHGIMGAVVGYFFTADGLDLLKKK